MSTKLKQHFLCSVLALCFSSASHGKVADASVVLTLETAKEYAIRNNFDVQERIRALEAANANVSLSKAPYYPEVGIAAGIENDTSSTRDLVVSVAYGYATWNLFNGFADLKKSDRAKLRAQLAEVELKMKKFQVGLEVEDAFRQFLFLTAQLVLNEEALSLNEKHKATAKRRRRSGLVSDSDVMEFDLQDSRIQSEIANLKQEKEVARVDLKRLLGRDIGENINPVGELKHYHLIGSLGEYAQRIKDTNIDVKSAQLKVKDSELGESIAKSEWFPRLDLESRFGNLPLEAGSQDRGAFAVGLTAKVDLFSGFETHWKRKEAVAQRFVQEARLKNAILHAVTAMEVAFRKIKAIEERVHFEGKNVERAHKYYRSVLSEYSRGVKNSADVKAAAEGWFESRRRMEQFKHDFLEQKVAFERVLGTAAQTEVMTLDHNH